MLSVHPSPSSRINTLGSRVLVPEGELRRAVDQSAKEERSSSLFTLPGGLNRACLLAPLLPTPFTSNVCSLLLVKPLVHRHKKVSILRAGDNQITSWERTKDSPDHSQWLLSLFSMKLYIQCYSNIHGKENTADVVESVTRLGQSEWNTLSSVSKSSKNFVPISYPDLDEANLTNYLEGDQSRWSIGHIKTNSQVMDTLHCQSRTKVKVVKWC